MHVPGLPFERSDGGEPIAVKLASAAVVHDAIAITRFLLSGTWAMPVPWPNVVLNHAA